MNLLGTSQEVAISAIAEIDIREVERRLLRACKTMRALPDREKHFFRYKTLWPAVLRTLEEAYGYDETRLPRFRPTPADVSDCLTALSWARGLAEDKFKLIFLRSCDLSFRTIAERIAHGRRKSDETVRRWYKDAVIVCWRNASMASGGYFASPS